VASLSNSRPASADAANLNRPATRCGVGWRAEEANQDSAVPSSLVSSRPTARSLLSQSLRCTLPDFTVGVDGYFAEGR